MTDKQQEKKDMKRIKIVLIAFGIFFAGYFLAKYLWD